MHNTQHMDGRSYQRILPVTLALRSASPSGGPPRNCVHCSARTCEEGSSSMVTEKYRQSLEVFVGESVPKGIVGKFGVPRVSAWHTGRKSVVTSCCMTLGDHEVAGTWIWEYVFCFKAFTCRIVREHSLWVCLLVDGCLSDKQAKGIGVTRGCQLWRWLFWWFWGSPWLCLGDSA